ncbi:hypothetical protein SAMN04488515_2667 [Cognatiyoonia koreensis]|uniref:Uncharacterized protein n=1 Tax=Cognatiyoonia koreensis TaxID=364200 RepID=A0A1I0RHG6_9RHOB|nr:hypothetical protein [Cognatiyoonia koreensis]SEW40116.1 hypothetical protein SAMN04488515_2667 [Cognatiyoonia koreensis]
MIRRIHQSGVLDWGEAVGASAVVHIAAAAFIFDLWGDLSLRLPDPEEAPPITVTSIVLGSDTITTATNQGDGTTPQSNDNTTETLASAEPESLEPVSPGNGDEPDGSEPVSAEPIEPVGPDDGAGAVEPSILRPAETGISVGGATVVGEGTVAVQPERVGAIERLPVIDTTSSAAAPANDGNGGVEASGEINELIRRIRAQLDDPCLLAIPQQGGSGTPELLMLGNTDTQMRAFADTVLTGLTPRPAERSILVDARQCAALNYVRQSEAYPAFRLTLSLDSQIIESGENLTGTIGNVGGRYVTLILVDDNGVVQELGEYLTFRGGFAQFDVPLNRAGLVRDTSQVLMAFASAARPATVDAENGQLAETYFASLRSELGTETPMVMVPFNVR